MKHEYKVGDWVLRPDPRRFETGIKTYPMILSRITEVFKGTFAKVDNDHDTFNLWHVSHFRPLTFAAWVEVQRREKDEV